MSIIVQKFGGTSVGNIERINNVADIIITEKNKGNQVIVVVSAMATVTNSLASLVKENFKVESQNGLAEIDSILSSGEQVSSALLALALQEKGYSARSYLGWQIPIETDSKYGCARIKSINTKIFDEKEIPIVSGFQGINSDGRITTLGRGGSDTTAAAIAAAIKADRCDIYTDVEGIFTCDPRIVKNAKKLDRISYEETLEIASLGAKVLQIRSVEIAMNYNIPLKVLSSFNKDSGTMLTTEDKQMEKRIITAVTYTRNEARINISGVPVTKGAVSIFDHLEDINIDTIVQNMHSDGESLNVTFTVPGDELSKTVERLKKNKNKILYKSLVSEENLAKVSVVGVGMKSQAGVARDMFKALFEKSIDIKVISTSEIKISVIIPEEYLELAVRTLHSKFELEK
ncbi:MAG: aspartate kinase [Rickettsiales bacterium]